MKFELVVERHEIVPGCGMWMEITRKGTLHDTVKRFLRRKVGIGELRKEVTHYRRPEVA